MRNCLMIFALSMGLYAADCDVVFSLTAAGDTVQFNNKGKACANFQVSYFASGFSALSLQFESAPDAGTTPGTWVAFAGTTLSGSNPMTTITQATSTFSGVYPWLRVRLVSKTGTGQITGRILGIQLTSAGLGFTDAFLTGIFGRFTTPDDSTFTWVDQGAGATTTVITNGTPGIEMYIPFASASNVRRKKCVSLPSGASYTVTAAFLPYSSQNNQASQGGLTLRDTVTQDEEEAPVTWTELGGNRNGLQSYGMFRCTDGTTATCTDLIAAGNYNLASSAIWWTRVVSTATTRTWNFSFDGINWHNPFFQEFVVTGANYAAITPNQACWYGAATNGNYSFRQRLVSWSVQ